MKTAPRESRGGEMLAGLAFALFPRDLFFFVLGVPLDASGTYAFCMFGAAIFVTGLACWLAPKNSASKEARGFVAATAFYAFIFVSILLALRFVGGLSGMALWPTVVLHLGLVVSLLFCLRQGSVVRVG